MIDTKMVDESHKRIRDYLENDSAFEHARLDELLSSCSWLLHSFVADNFTGHELPFDIDQFIQSLPNEFRDTPSVEFDNLKPVNYSRNVALLSASKRIAEKTCEKYPESIEATVLLFRVMHVLQLTLSEKSPTLKQRVFTIINRLHTASTLLMQSSEEPFRAFLTGVMLEAVRVCLFYHETTQATTLLRKVSEALNFAMKFSGALGKRTRFQQDAIAQMIVRTTRLGVGESADEKETAVDADADSESSIGTTLEARIDVIVNEENENGPSAVTQQRTHLRRLISDDATLRAVFVDYGCDSEKHREHDTLPTGVQLNDDTLLPSVRFEQPQTPEQEAEAGGALKCIEQALLLAHCDVERRTQAHEDLVVRAQTSAVIELLVSQPRCFATHFESLLIRSRLDSAGSSRTLERALSQYEHLASLTLARTADCNGESDRSRLHSFFWVNVAPRWRTEFEYAAMLMRIGMFQNALDVYTRLESWSDMVTCYRRLGRLNAAQDLIRERITILNCELEQLEALTESSKSKQIDATKWKLADLYCALGEVTGGVEYLERAWTISGERHAASQSVLGFVELANRHVDEALAAFERSLRVRPLHFGTQFAFGCLSLQRTLYQQAIRAFRVCVSLEPEDARAWSNLAAALVRCGEKRKALTLLDEAVRCQFEDWRIWENYLLVAIDCGALPDAARAVHRLVDLRKEDRALDRDMLDALVNGATAAPSEKRDGNNSPTADALAKYRKQLRELFARLSSTRAIRAWFFWFAYARLTHFEYQSTQTPDGAMLDRTVEHVQRALRALLSNETVRRSEPNESQQQSALSTGAWERDPERRAYVALVCSALLRHLDEYAAAAAAVEESRKAAVGEKCESHRNAARLTLNNVTAIVRKYKDSIITPKGNELEELDQFLCTITQLQPTA